MKPIQTTLPRFKPMYGWANRILRVDLTEGRIWAQETAPRVPAFIGARGLAAKIVWNEYPTPVDPFDPLSPLMVMPGALTGTISPYSGRTCICGFGPQGLPYNWFTRSNIGANWGALLKRAGYDGLVVTGASESPVLILIQDDVVSILPADDLWGLDTFEAQAAVQAVHGKAVRTLTIGAAGERLSRIATVQTDTTSVAGQGGFGAIMGAKKLKAISVAGTGRVSVADPDRLRALRQGVGAYARAHRGPYQNHDAVNKALADEGGGHVRAQACTEGCPAPCRSLYTDVQGCHFDRKWTGAMACVSGTFGGRSDRSSIYDWHLSLRETIELNLYANSLGLNHWDILVGMIPWLRACNRHGLLDEVNGVAFDLDSVDFWVHLLHDMAHREGMGDALSEGGYRAAGITGLGVELMRRYYSGWGYSGHWDGHAAFVNNIVFPFWIVSAIHWAMDTRDPASSTHGYIQSVMRWGPFGRRRRGAVLSAADDPPITWDQMRAIGERVYGRADALDPLSGYEGKAVPAAFHGVRSVMKDCLPVDDQVFPLIYSHASPDGFCRIGDIDGTDIEAALLRAGTGLDWDTAEFERAAERVLNLERAIQVRHWARTRAVDERVLPAFAYDENWVNPELGERKRLDPAEFGRVMDDYLCRRGWDAETGWPTQERLASLGLAGVHEEMVAGARAAAQRLPELPPEPPVWDHHADDPERAA